MSHQPSSQEFSKISNSLNLGSAFTNQASFSHEDNVALLTQLNTPYFEAHGLQDINDLVQSYATIKRKEAQQLPEQRKAIIRKVFAKTNKKVKCPITRETGSIIVCSEKFSNAEDLINHINKHLSGVSMTETEPKQTVLNFQAAPVVIEEIVPDVEEVVPVVIEEETKQRWSTVHNGVTLWWDRKEQADEIVKQQKKNKLKREQQTAKQPVVEKITPASVALLTIPMLATTELAKFIEAKREEEPMNEYIEPEVLSLRIERHLAYLRDKRDNQKPVIIEQKPKAVIQNGAFSLTSLGEDDYESEEEEIVVKQTKPIIEEEAIGAQVKFNIDTETNEDEFEEEAVVVKVKSNIDEDDSNGDEEDEEIVTAKPHILKEVIKRCKSQDSLVVEQKTTPFHNVQALKRAAVKQQQGIKLKEESAAIQDKINGYTVEELKSILSLYEEHSSDRSLSKYTGSVLGIQCNRCCQEVYDIGKAKVVCQQCLVVKPANVVDIEPNYIEEPTDDITKEAVVDFRPILVGYKLKIYCPTKDKPFRVINVPKIRFYLFDQQHADMRLNIQGDLNYIEMSVYQYRMAQEYITAAYTKNEKIINYRKEASIFKDIDLTEEQIAILYQQNPRLGESKAFYTKMMLDYNLKFEMDKYITGYTDIESSTCDKIYRDIPQPYNRKNKITMIQCLLDYNSQDKTTEVYIYHLKGYQYNMKQIEEKFAFLEQQPTVDSLDKQTKKNYDKMTQIEQSQFMAQLVQSFKERKHRNTYKYIIESYKDERTMVDAYFNHMMSIKQTIVMSGFNAFQATIYKSDKDDKKNKPEAADKEFKDFDAQYRKFHGYDINFLVARSGYRFTPNNTQMKVADSNVMATQIKQLPNVLFLDYQGLILNYADQKMKNKMGQKTLDGLLSIMFDQNSKINEIGKIAQDMYQLQKNFHEQTKDKYEKVDLTQEFIYSINDVVCLHRCEQEMGYIAQRIIGRMEVNQIGTSLCMTGTESFMNQIWISRCLMEQGLNYNLSGLDNKEEGVTGAYTNNDVDYIYKVTQCVRQDDYNSLYPSIIMLHNICYTTFIGETTDPDSYDKEKFSVIDVSDDKMYCNREQRTYAVFTKEKLGIMNSVSQKLMAQRRKYKAEMEKHPKGSALYNKYNQLQNTVKTQMNAFYGGASCKSNPYFARIVAAAITAGARFALQQLNRGVHNLEGMLSKETGKDEKRVDFIEGESMIKVETKLKDDSIKTEWKRNYYNVQDGARSRIAQNDTDATFYAIQDMKWFQDALAKPADQRQLFKQFDDQLKQLVETYTNGGKILTFACEELIAAQLTSKAKKSYARLDICSNTGKGKYFEHDYVDILNDITVSTNKETGFRTFDKQTIKKYLKKGRMALQIKGVSWSNFDTYMKKEIEDLFLDMILTGEIWPTIQKVQIKLMIKYQESMQKLISGDATAQEDLKQFARKIKLHGKSDMVMYLRKNTAYNLDTDVAYILPLRAQFKGQKKSTLWIPIQYITADNYQRVDDQSILATFNSQMTKFFSSETGSKVTQVRSELALKQEPDQILVRVEKSKSRWERQELVQVDCLKQFILDKEGCTIHESICKDEIKLYFDLDKQPIQLSWFEQLVKKALQYRSIPVDRLEMYVVRRETSQEYNSYHITFNIVMAMQMIKQIAEHVKNMGKKSKPTLDTNWLDTQVYKQNATIRLPFCLKTDDFGNLNKLSRLTTDVDMKDVCVTYTEGYQKVDLPMCFSTKPIIDFTMDLCDVNVSDQFAPQAYKDAIKCFEFKQTDDKSARFIRAKVVDGMVCPACKKLHDPVKDGYIVSTWKNRSSYGFLCYKQRHDGLKSELKIPVSKEQSDEIKKKIKEMKINVNQRIKNRFVPTQCIKDKVIYDMKNRLTFVQANMGVGKTEQLIEILKKELLEEQKNCVMLSVRETLSTDWIRRYRSVGIEVADYREFSGKIRPQPGKITVIQVDSIARIHTEEIDIFVLDEMQSIMEQLTSDQISDTSGVQLKFIDMLQCSDKILCMDANMRETTVDLIESFVGEQGRFVWNNTKKYEHLTAQIRPLLLGKTDHMLEYFKEKVITQGKNVICNFSEIKMAEKVVRYLRQLDATIPIKFYHGDNKRVCHEIDPENGNKINVLCDENGKEYGNHKLYKQAEFKDVNKTWKQARVVIYTGTLSSGVNFTEEHFHENISCFTNRAGSADMFTQGLMRCRNLIDNKMTIYIDKQAKVSPYTTNQMYTEFSMNMDKYKIVDTACTADLFNFQMYMQAYKKHQKGCYTDIIISALNEMGMKLEYDDLDAADIKRCAISKKIRVTASKLTSEDIMQDHEVDLVVCEAYLNKNDEQKEQEILKDYEGDVSKQYKLIQFVATTYNKQLKTQNAFESAQRLLECYDDRIYGLNFELDRQEDEEPYKRCERMLKEYYSYLDYSTTYKIFASNGEQLHTYTQQDLYKHIQVKLQQYNKSMSGTQSLKYAPTAVHKLPQLAQKVQKALEFTQMCDKQMEETGEIAESKEIKDFAKKEFGVSSIRNYGSIFKCIGLWFIATDSGRTQEKNEDGTPAKDEHGRLIRKRQYAVSWTPYFDRYY